MSGFTVDPQTLNTLATVLQNLGSDLNMIHDGRGQLHDAVVAGEYSPGLVGGPSNYDSDAFSTGPFDSAGNALESFAGDWSNGIAQLNKEAADVASALQQAASAYQSTESDLAKAITPAGSPAPAGSPVPPVHHGGPR